MLSIAPKEKIIHVRTIMFEEFEEREDQGYLTALEDAATAAERGDEPTESNDEIAESYAEDTPEVYEAAEVDAPVEEDAEIVSNDGDEKVED